MSAVLAIVRRELWGYFVTPVAYVFMVIFLVLAFLTVFTGRTYYARNPVESADPHLNTRTSRLIGQVVTVESAIENGKGRVRVGDGVWNAAGPDAPAGSSVRIVSAEGTCLTVEPA